MTTIAPTKFLSQRVRQASAFLFFFAGQHASSDIRCLAQGGSEPSLSFGSRKLTEMSESCCGVDCNAIVRHTPLLGVGSTAALANGRLGRYRHWGGLPRHIHSSRGGRWGAGGGLACRIPPAGRGQKKPEDESKDCISSGSREESGQQVLCPPFRGVRGLRGRPNDSSRNKQGASVAGGAQDVQHTFMRTLVHFQSSRKALTTEAPRHWI